MRKGIMALEDLNDNADLFDVSVGDLVSANVEVEDNLADITESVIGASLDLEDIDKASAVESTLNDISANVEKAQEEGGLTQSGAKAIEIAVESLLISIGYKNRSRKFFPAMEGFSKVEDRKEATSFVLESFKEKAKEIWNAIMRALTNAIDWVKTFVNKLRYNTKGIEKRNNQMKELGKGLRGMQVNNGEIIKSSRLAEFLDSSLENTNPENFLKALTKNNNLVAGYGSALQDMASKTGENLSKLINSSSSLFHFKSDSTPEFLLQKTLTPFFTNSTNSSSNKEVTKHYGPSIAVNEYPMLFGNTSFILTLFKHGAFSEDKPLGMSDINQLGVKVVPVRETTITNEEIKPLSGDEGFKIVDFIDSFIKTTAKNTDRDFNEITTALDKLKKEAVKQMSDTSFYNNNSVFFQYAYAVVRAILRIVTQGQTALRIYELKVIKQSLDYVAASFSLIAKSGNMNKDGEIIPEGAGRQKALAYNK